MKLKIILLLFVVSAPFLGCASLTFKSETRAVDNFHSINVSGLADVYITQSEFNRLSMKVRGMPIADVLTKVEGGVLNISTKGSHSGESVKVYVDYRQLINIRVGGAATLKGLNKLVTNKLIVKTEDAGDVDYLEIEATDLVVSINDSGNANLKVDVGRSNIEMKDSGDLKIYGVAKIQNVKSHGSRGSLDNANLTYK